MGSIRTGFKSTEFYITLLILGLAAAFGSPVDTPWQARLGLFFGAVASGIAYKVARTSQKNAAVEAQAQLGGPASVSGGGISAPDRDGPRPLGFRGFAKLRLLVALAVGAVLTLGAAGCFSAARKAELRADLTACGISVGLAELQTVNDQAHAVLGDGSISDVEAHDALGALAGTAKAGLVKCVLELAADVFGPEPVAAPEAPARAVVANALISPARESAKERKRRRALAYLGR